MTYVESLIAEKSIPTSQNSYIRRLLSLSAPNSLLRRKPNQTARSQLPWILTIDRRNSSDKALERGWRVRLNRIAFARVACGDFCINTQ
jgi:hypothetical protein